MGIQLTPEERFEVFGNFVPEDYEQEVKERWKRGSAVHRVLRPDVTRPGDVSSRRHYCKRHPHRAMNVRIVRTVRDVQVVRNVLVLRNDPNVGNDPNEPNAPNDPNEHVYSRRRAVTGSMRIARRSGTRIAAIVVTAKTARPRR
jgi:hypothetical protein